MFRPTYIPTWFCTLIGAAVTMALFFGIYSFAYLEGVPQFVGVSHAESDDETFPTFSSTLIAGCTTKTVGIQTRKFKGTTSIATGCPESRNVCSEFICNDERICEEVLLSTSTCSEDFDCDLFERCDTSTCSCVPDGTQCTEDSQCLNVNMTSVCTETFCDVDQGQCKTRFINEVADSCETNNNCPGLQICQDCLCVDPGDVNGTFFCFVDSDCTDFIETSSCVETFCNVTTATCATRFVDMSFDCDGSCPSGQVCNDCVCETIPTGANCVVDTDCLNFTTTSDCVETFCDMNQCATRYIGMGDCDSNSQCGAGQVCSNCTCQAPDACQATGYDMQPLSVMGFSCGLDVAIDGDVLVTLCTDDPLNNPELTLISFVKSGTTWTQADTQLSGIFKDSNIPIYVPAIDMDGGFVVAYGNNVNVAGVDRSLEIFSIDGAGNMSPYQTFVVNSNDGSTAEPS